MGRREIFHTCSLLVEIEGHFTHEFVNYVYETEDWSIYTNYSLTVVILRSCLLKLFFSFPVIYLFKISPPIPLLLCMADVKV
jgi:hypothetical protein